MWQEVERRGEKVFHKSRCCFRNKRSSLSPASRCVMLPGRYPDCSEGIVYFVKKKKKPTGNCLFMFCFVFFRFIFRQRGMTGNLNTIEKKPVVVKLSTLVSFFRAQSSSSSPCVCAPFEMSTVHEADRSTRTGRGRGRCFHFNYRSISS